MKMFCIMERVVSFVALFSGFYEVFCIVKRVASFLWIILRNCAASGIHRRPGEPLAEGSRRRENKQGEGFKLDRNTSYLNWAETWGEKVLWGLTQMVENPPSLTFTKFYTMWVPRKTWPPNIIVSYQEEKNQRTDNKCWAFKWPQNCNFGLCLGLLQYFVILIGQNHKLLELGWNTQCECGGQTSTIYGTNN